MAPRKQVEKMNKNELLERIGRKLTKQQLIDIAKHLDSGNQIRLDPPTA